MALSSARVRHTPIRSNALDSPPASEDLLGPLPEEKDTRQDVEPPADQEVVMATGDDCPADAMNIAVPTLRPSRSEIRGRAQSL